MNQIKEACSRNGGGTVVLFCDAAQRYEENEYEWLRDVHDHLDRQERVQPTNQSHSGLYRVRQRQSRD
jgi:hypothetical protein